MNTAKNTLSEFKDFISKGNVIDLAVGVIIGGAFGKIVTSLVDDILMPIVGIILGGVHFESLSIKIGEASIAYGAFIQSIVDFLIIAASIFIFVKCIKNITKNTAPAPMAVENKKLEQKETQEIVVLKEIRDALKNK